MNFLRVVQRVICIVFFTLAGPLFSSASSSEDARELRIAAETFRRVAVENFVEALQYYSTPTANLKFVDLGNDMWPVTDPASGWSLFFSTTLVNMSNIGSGSKTVTFSHPWSETALVTLWEEDADGELRMMDASMLIDSFIYGEGPPYPTVRMWQVLDFYGPEGVGLYNAGLTVEIEALFASQSQKAIADLQPGLLEGLTFAASKMFMGFQADLLPVLRATDGNAAQTRDLWNTLFSAVAANETLFDGRFPDQMKTFTLLEDRIWNSFVPVAYQSTEHASLLMLASVENPDLYIAMQQEHSSKGVVLKRLNLYSFNSFYDYFLSAQGDGE